MPITDWPINERPREKLINLGAESLSDAELLAIFLRTGVKGKTAVDLARELLSEYGSLRALMNADRNRFNQSHGLGNAKFVLLQAVLEMSKRHLKENIQRGDALCNPDASRKYLISELRAYPYEVFACLFLDNQHRIINFDEIFRGTIDSTGVYTREIVRRALQLIAAAVIFAHNHPSGASNPSDADKNITTKLISALSLMDIRVLDHFIIGDGAPFSFAENGLL